jgi:hypothetical protein
MTEAVQNLNISRNELKLKDVGESLERDQQLIGQS